MNRTKNYTLIVAVFTLLFFANQTGISQEIENGSEAVQREVRVPTIFPNVELAGTLSLPARKGLHPAILLITSAGGQTRDQVISGVPMFKILADHLTRAGFAVLRVDDRGVGKSTGPSVWDSTTGDKATDMQSCVDFLKRLPGIDAKRIGLIGHSEGAMVAPMVALKEPDIRFVVLLASPGVSGGDVWNRQQNEGAKERTKSESILKALEVERRKMIEFIKSGKNDDETFYRLGHDYFAAFRMPESMNTKQLTDENFGILRKKWFGFFFAFDPATNLRKLLIPTLLIAGSADEQVALEQNLAPAASAMIESKNPDFAIVVLPKQDHFFIVREDSSTTARPGLSSAMLETVTQWTKQHIR